MVGIGKALNLNTKALITNMDQPLGATVGNGLELLEAIDLLEGKLDNDFYDLVFEFASLVASPIEVKDVIRSGKAAVKFEEWIAAQGGDLTNIREVNEPKFKLDCKANKDAYVKTLDAKIVGEVSHELGYKPKSDGSYDIDNTAGVKFKAKVGSQVKPSDVLFTVQANTEAGLEAAKDKILSAYKFSDSKTKEPKLVLRKY